MKLKNTHLLIDVISQDPKKYSNYKKLVLSDRSQKYSKNVKLNIDSSSGNAFISSMDIICNSLNERKYLFFFPNVDNNVVEVSKENGIFEINFHIGYRGEFFTFVWSYKIGEGFVNVPKFNTAIKFFA